MSSIIITFIVFACVFVGSLLGFFLRPLLPEHHLSQESKSVITLGMGLVGTMAALVLGLLIAAAQSSFTTQRNDIMEISANVIFLDSILADYGPETKEARDLLRSSVVRSLNQLWPEENSQPVQLDPHETRTQAIYDKILSLRPRDDAQRSLQAQALSVAFNLVQTRWLMFVQEIRSIPLTFVIVLAVLVFWLSSIFFSFGLYAPPNATVIVTMFLSALAVSAAIFLIVELNRPFDGLLRIPSTPLHTALDYLGK